jgi:spore germination protein YaaH
MRPTLRVFALLALLGLAGCSLVPGGPADEGPSGSPTPTPGPPPPLSFSVYHHQSSDPGLIDQSAEAISTLIIDGVNLENSDAAVTAVSVDTTDQLERAKYLGLPTEIMVSNYSYEDLTFAVLSNPAAMTNTVGALTRIVTEQGWGGVSIDFESLTRRDAAGLVEFAAQLRAALPEAATISMAISLNFSERGYTRAGYDLAALAPNIDQFVLMAYDQNGPWSTASGPVGALDWGARGLEAMLTVVPPEKVSYGIAGYGYRWGGDEVITKVTVAEARAEANADTANTVFWDPDVGEWSATLTDGTELWWSDARSFRARVELAQSYQLRGVALWLLGSADPITPDLLE